MAIAEDPAAPATPADGGAKTNPSSAPAPGPGAPKAPRRTGRSAHRARLASDPARQGLEEKERDSYAVTAFAEIVDRSLHAAAARFTMGLSPAALAETYFDWATHLVFSPGKQVQLIDKATRKAMRLAGHAARGGFMDGGAENCIEPLPQDRRFDGAGWRNWPYNFIHQAFLLNQQWWHNATTGVRGVSRQHEAMAQFVSRQILDMYAPSNFILTNPELLQRTVQSGAMNLVAGYRNLLDDMERRMSGKKPVGAEDFRVGRDVGVTPGKVIYRNRLIELIQYAPATDKVRPEPVLITPAWIMKYYILDLSPHNSLVKHLTEQGFTVFMISWRNPGAEDRDLTLDDYRTLGVMDALDAIDQVAPGAPVHGVGYCLGGTLLSIAAAAMARDGDDRLKTITLLAAQTDFEEAGELMLFINNSQLSFLEDMMWEQGFLDTSQMSGAFQMLRSNDLIWSRLVHDYYQGERAPMTDLMAWNADATRMPYRMHAEYLRRLFLDNDLAEGRLLVDDKPVSLSDVRAPIYAVGAVHDHVAPWRSTYKIHLLTDTEVTFVLTSGGHNAGIVSEPGRPGRQYQVLTKPADAHYAAPASFLARAPAQEGSWWEDWVAWLGARSGALIEPPPVGIPGREPDCDAPGTYVLQA